MLVGYVWRLCADLISLLIWFVLICWFGFNSVVWVLWFCFYIFVCLFGLLALFGYL